MGVLMPSKMHPGIHSVPKSKGLALPLVHTPVFSTTQSSVLLPILQAIQNTTCSASLRSLIHSKDFPCDVQYIILFALFNHVTLTILTVITLNNVHVSKMLLHCIPFSPWNKGGVYIEVPCSVSPAVFHFCLWMMSSCPQQYKIFSQ